MAVISTFAKVQTPKLVRFTSDWADIAADSIDLSWDDHDDMRGFQVGVQMADGAVGTPGTYGVATSGKFEVFVGHMEALESLDAALDDIGGTTGIPADLPEIKRHASHSIRRVNIVRNAIVAGTMTQFRLVVSLYPN